jgi:ubiquinone/menaquinone biosynthesis C-methylase UbiE
MAQLPGEDWGGEAGRRWLSQVDRFESMLDPVGKALIAMAQLKPGEKLADVGCGGGATTLEIANAVAPHGYVTGIDISPELVTLASRRRQAADVPNCSFHCADAQITSAYGTPLDRVLSRFGVMFFADSTVAFTNMRSWLRPGGEMVFACWGPPQDNPWFVLAGSVFARFITLPERDPAGPGPFRFADPDTTGMMLRAAGFKEVSFSPYQSSLALGGAGASPAEAADFVMAAMSVALPLAEIGEADRQAARAALIEALLPYARAQGVMLPGSCWLVRARNPAMGD